MKDGAILANTGHFNVEIEIPALRQMATESRAARPFVEEFRLPNDRRLFLLADGRLINLAAAEGHPAQVMDMSFANQALSAEFVVQNAGTLDRKVYPVPADIDKEIARLKLETMGVASTTSPRSRPSTSSPGTRGPNSCRTRTSSTSRSPASPSSGTGWSASERRSTRSWTSSTARRRAAGRVDRRPAPGIRRGIRGMGGHATTRPRTPSLISKGPSWPSSSLVSSPGAPSTRPAAPAGQSAVLAELGHDLVGVDASPAMLEKARARVPDADFRIGELTALPLDAGSVRSRRLFPGADASRGSRAGGRRARPRRPARRPDRSQRHPSLLGRARRPGGFP